MKRRAKAEKLAAKKAAKALAAELGLEADKFNLKAQVKHSVTRYRITLSLVSANLDTAPEPSQRKEAQLRWVSSHEAAKLAMPASLPIA